MAVKLKRVYLKPEKSDGCRILVDRLWPRGLSKQKARVDHWLRDIAPSTGLRKWYGHEPERWAEFKRRYGAELKGEKDALQELKLLLKQHSTVTFLFSSKEERLNNAAALVRIAQLWPTRSICDDNEIRPIYPVFQAPGGQKPPLERSISSENQRPNCTDNHTLKAYLRK